jgi:hypothetical protein
MEKRPRVFSEVAERFATGALPKNKPRVKATPRVLVVSDEVSACTFWCPFVPCRWVSPDTPDKA